MNYLLKMRNPKSGKVEAYTTRADDEHTLELGLNFWRELGYEIISCEIERSTP